MKIVVFKEFLSDNNDSLIGGPSKGSFLFADARLVQTEEMKFLLNLFRESKGEFSHQPMIL